jgi:hypothetical protein
MLKSEIQARENIPGIHAFNVFENPVGATQHIKHVVHGTSHQAILKALFQALQILLAK